MLCKTEGEKRRRISFPFSCLSLNLCCAQRPNFFVGMRVVCLSSRCDRTLLTLQFYLPHFSSGNTWSWEKQSQYVFIESVVCSLFFFFFCSNICDHPVKNTDLSLYLDAKKNRLLADMSRSGRVARFCKLKLSVVPCRIITDDINYTPVRSGSEKENLSFHTLVSCGLRSALLNAHFYYCRYWWCVC